MPSSAAEKPADRSQGYDFALRRRATRTRRQKGCYVYIPAGELVKTGFSPDGPVPFYRVWGAARGRVVVQLYREK
jgi:hypothetical protein